VELQELYGDLLAAQLPDKLDQKAVANPGFKPLDIPNYYPVDRASDIQSGPKIGYDQSGFVTDINYPDGKMRHIDRDQTTHEATAIFTQDRDGITKLVNQNGTWFMEVQGMNLPFPGKIDVSKDGDIAMQTNASGVWRIEKANGSVSEEKENEDGARASFDSNHQIAKITRKDGASFEQLDQNRIVESHPGSKPITWTNLGGLWTSDSGDKPRKNMAMHDNATVTYEDSNAVKHTINGRGIETLEGAGMGKITPDISGRPQEVETADGQKVRKYTYFDEVGSDIKSVTIVDKKDNSTVTYSRESKDANQWRNEKGGYWQGNIKVSPDGVHSVRSSQYGAEESGKWTSYHPDGRQTSDTINLDGSRSSYDESGALVSFRGADGSRMDRFSINGRDTIQHYNPKIGETITWTKGSDGFFKSDSARFPDARKDLTFSTNGEQNYSNEKGARVLERRDGTKQIVEKDGTKLDVDEKNQTVRATKGNLERTFIRDDNGIVAVRDRNTTSKEERIIFERRPAGEENRSNINIAPNGDLSYQNPDGSAVIERSNMLRLDLDKDGDITRVVGPKGSRVYQYIGEGDHKVVANVLDTRKTEKGEKTEQWTRVANPDGTLSNEFRSRQDDGKDRKPRYNLTPCAEGEYEYKLASDKPGDKAHVEKLVKESADGMPESVEEAREALMGVLENVMDKARYAANVVFMKKFEQRMMDQTELQVAAGLDPEKVMKETAKCITETYFNCARLAGTPKGQNEMYGLKDRVRLAENLLYLANDPTDIKQGGQGTCWWESSWNVGLFQRNAGCAARFCADIALKSEYTSTAGPLKGGPPKTIKIPRQYVGLNSSDSGAGWTPQNSHRSSQRSMVGMLIDQVGPPLGGQRGWGQSNAGWHTEARNILYMMTGRDNIRHGDSGIGRHEKLELLKTGGWTSSGGNHMWGYTMHKEKNGSWVVIKDDQYEGGDHVIQRIANLKQWIGSDIQRDVRSQWKPSKPRPGQSTDSAPSYMASNASNNTYRPRTNNSLESDRINVIQMNKPVWQNSRMS
jgi:hypothetical protein